MDLVERVIFPASIVQGQQLPNVRAATLESLMDQEYVNVRMDSTEIRREAVYNARPIVQTAKLRILLALLATYQ
jgi:hypothetical protein